LDITTKYATGEEVILANFSGKCKTATLHSGGEGYDEANIASQHHYKKKKKGDKKCHGKEMGATAE